jgi:hypothetical protein
MESGQNTKCKEICETIKLNFEEVDRKKIAIIKFGI